VSREVPLREVAELGSVVGMAHSKVSLSNIIGTYFRMPPKTAPKRKKVAAKKNVPAKPKRAASKRVIPSTLKHAKSAPRAKKKS
jgi:hypothetical protein